METPSILRARINLDFSDYMNSFLIADSTYDTAQVSSLSQEGNQRSISHSYPVSGHGSTYIPQSENLYVYFQHNFLANADNNQV